MTTFRVGDRAIYRGAWGTEEPVPCTVTGIGEKNDRVVYDNDLGHWGYTEQYRPVRSYKTEVIADSSGQWCGNALRFETREQAHTYVIGLSWRWTAVRDTRVVESDDPVTEPVAPALALE